MTIQHKREQHGMAKTPTYHTWAMMRQRCNNEKQAAYKHYGGRGIKVCGRWNNSFLAFLEDMGEKPEGMTLDRIDNDGDYCPENCRWATPKEQSNNTRRTRYITVEGKRRRAMNIAKENGVKPQTFYNRIGNGWSLEESVGIEEHYDPRGITIGDETMTMAQWAKKIGISRQAVHIRLETGWSIEEALTTPKGERRPSIPIDSATGKPQYGPRKPKYRNTKLGAYLTELRLGLGMSQAQVAKCVGIATSTLSHYERGKIEPRAKNMTALARVFDISAHELWALTKLQMVLTRFNTNGMIDLRKEVAMTIDARERDAFLQVRMTESEKTLLSELAAEYGVSVSAFVRMMMMHFDEKRPTVAVRFGPKADALIRETPGT